jgi:hypothetical protein
MSGRLFQLHACNEMKPQLDNVPGCDVATSHRVQAMWNLPKDPSLKAISHPRESGGVVLPGNTYGEDVIGGLELALDSACFTTLSPYSTPPHLTVKMITYMN